MLPTRDPPHNKNLHRLKVKGWKNIINKWTGEKKLGQQYSYQTKQTSKKKGHKKRLRRSLHNTQGKDPSRRHTITNIYAPNIGAPRNIRKILEDIKKDIDSNTIIVADFNTPLPTMDRSSKQNSKDIMELNDAFDHIDLTDVYRSFHPKEAKYTFFSNAPRTL